MRKRCFNKYSFLHGPAGSIGIASPCESSNTSSTQLGSKRTDGMSFALMAITGSKIYMIHIYKGIDEMVKYNAVIVRKKYKLLQMIYYVINDMDI